MTPETPVTPRHAPWFLRRRLPIRDAGSVTFEGVWYRATPTVRLLIGHDTGRLIVSDRVAEFTGGHGVVTISAVRRVSLVRLSQGNAGPASFCRWVRLDFGDAETAMFCDGAWRGWSGAFGGNRAIFEACQVLRSHS